MAATRTEACCFQSSKGGGWVTASQFLAEFMCLRQAVHQRKDLSDRFWQKPYWKRTFLVQLRHANNLLKLYPIEAILKTLREDAPKVFSLALKSLDGMIEARAEEMSRQKPKQGATLTPQLPAKPEKPRESFGKSKLEQMKEM